MTTMNAATTNPTHAGLRAWAKGMYPTEAAVELLIRTRFATRGYAWIFECDPWGDAPPMYGVDFPAIPENIGAYSGGERRLLKIVASLGGVVVDEPLSELLPGLDREHMALVLAAMAHANGSHEHHVMGTIETARGHQVPWPTDELAGPLFPWPEERP